MLEIVHEKTQYCASEGGFELKDKIFSRQETKLRTMSLWEMSLELFPYRGHIFSCDKRVVGFA